MNEEKKYRAGVGTNVVGCDAIKINVGIKILECALRAAEIILEFFFVTKMNVLFIRYFYLEFNLNSRFASHCLP